ncbi:MAG: hypothetical protein LBS92_02710 [Candidatus Methanoplasma sp.]|jgi:hypothetical protein|nr:hypothetical protein [Candidatus Methanoplasma sp.]
MAMIDIEYRHSAEPEDDENIRRCTIEEMSDYLSKLVREMQLADISSKFTSSEHAGVNMVYINGKSIHEILEGLDIKMLEVEESCDHGKVGVIRFDRPTLDWKRDVIEDVPDVLVKNAVSKTYADIINGRMV